MNGKKLSLALACFSMPMMMNAQVLTSKADAPSNNQSLFGLSNLVKKITKKVTLAQSQVYLYNVEAGQFLGQEYSNTDYQYNLNAKAMGFSTTGKLWTINTYLLHDNLYRLTAVNGKDLCIGLDKNYGADWTYTYVGGSTSHVYTFDKIAGTNNYKISCASYDVYYGTEGFFAKNNYAFGTKTYLGWSGEEDFKIMLPLISANDDEPRGTSWYIMNEAEYAKYRNTIASAYEARMAAWPIIRSVRRSTMNIDITNLETVYNDFKSTAEQIEAAAAEAKAIILNSLNNATQNSYVDLSFMIADADCQAKEISSWTVDGEVSFNEKSVRTANKMFGGRFYETTGNTTVSQVIENLPAGRYTFSADVKATTAKGAVNGVQLFAGNNLAEASVAVTANGGINEFTTTQFTINDNSSKVNVGLRVDESNANNVAFDNFKIRYVGANAQKLSYASSATGSSKPVDNTSKNGYIVEDGTLYVTGTWNSADDQALLDYVVKSNPDIKTIDLQETDELPADATLDVTDFTNKNLLVYLPEDADATVVANGEEKTTNVVYGDRCENLVVEDRTDMTIVKSFTADNVSYTRVLSGETIGTICMPFALNTDSKIKLYKLKGFVDGSIKTRSVTSVPANEPCIFKNLTGESELIVVAQDAVIESTEAIITGPKTEDGIFLAGTYRNDFTIGKVGEEGAADGCYYMEDNKFKRGKECIHLDSYRAYIDTREYAPVNQSRSRSSVGTISDLDLATSIAEADAEDNDSEYYTINGTKTTSLNSGINIVKSANGNVKKIFIK